MKERKKNYLVFLLIFIPMLSLLGMNFQSSQRIRLKELSERHRIWLQRDVVYIITPNEKSVFLQLESERERDLFIEAFWKHRDPIPTTPENEFKVEHYKRLEYANSNFGKESPGPGWRTDMGKMYIILGQPKSIERYESYAEMYPTNIWYYQGMSKFGLPDTFNVVYFKDKGIGEYRLYSPIRFGPQELLIHFMGNRDDYVSAFRELLKIEPAVAESSITLIPGENSYGAIRPSIASDILLEEQIPTMPHRAVEDAYAEKLLRYKDIIEVDYTANYIGNEASLFISRDETGISYVHYAIEPSRLSFEQNQNTYHTRLDANVIVTDSTGKMVFQYDRRIPIRLDRGEFENIQQKLFSFQDVFPLIEGNFKLSVLLKNFVTKEFTSIEADLTIPSEDDLVMTPPLLANRMKSDSQYGEKNKPFLFGSRQLVTSPRNDFGRSDTLYAFFQIHGMKGGALGSGMITYSLLRDNEPIVTREKSVADYPDMQNFLEEFTLSDLPPAHYKLRISLLDASRKIMLSESEMFYVSYSPNLPRPWLLSVPLAPSSDPSYANIIGNQWLKTGEAQRAYRLLEEAYRRNPQSAVFAMDYCRVLFQQKKYSEVREIATLFAEDLEREQFLGLMGDSSQALGEYAAAVRYYKKHLERFGTNLRILNSIGLCYYKLGNIPEALVAWEKSLEIDPGQKDMEKQVGKLKNLRNEDGKDQLRR